jgi:hypothetical protein
MGTSHPALSASAGHQLRAAGNLARKSLGIGLVAGIPVCDYKIFTVWRIPVVDITRLSL